MNKVQTGGESMNYIYMVKWYSEFGNHSIEGISLISANTRNEADHQLKLSLLTNHNIPISSTTIKSIQCIDCKPQNTSSTKPSAFN